MRIIRVLFALFPFMIFGKIKASDRIFNTPEIKDLPAIESDTIEIKVIAQKISND